MNGYLLHEFIDHLEAPLRERALRDAAQRELALQGRSQPFGSSVRSRLGSAIVGLGLTIKGESARRLGDSANAAT